MPASLVSSLLWIRIVSISGTGSRNFMTINRKSFTSFKIIIIFNKKNIAVHLSLGLHEECPSCRRSFCPSKENILKINSLLFTFCGSFLPSWIRIKPTKIYANTCRSVSTIQAFVHHWSTHNVKLFSWNVERVCLIFFTKRDLNKDCHSILGMCESAYEDVSAMDTSQHYSGQTIGERIHSIQPVWHPGKNSALTAKLSCTTLLKVHEPWGFFVWGV